MSNKVSPLKIYKLLDRSNCKDCGMDSCLEFAKIILDRKVKLEQCTHIKQPDQLQNYYKIKELIQPPQWEIKFGKGQRACKIGGEEVLYRHQRTFFNHTAISIELHDSLKNIKEIVQYLTDLTVNRIGESIRLDALAFRFTSSNLDHFIETLKKIVQWTPLPVIICCLDPLVMNRAAKEIQEYRPLLYAATVDNLEAFAEIAKNLDLPIVAHDTDEKNLYNLVLSLKDYGIKDIILDPGIHNQKDQKSCTFNTYQKIRYQIFEKDIKEWGFPIMGVPASIWSQKDRQHFEPNSKEYHNVQYEEILTAIMLESIDTNLLVLHTGRNAEDIWGLLGLMTFRQNLFTDPREYPSVEPGLTTIGEPDEWSPIYVTSNYRMTKNPVEQDLIDAELNGYLVVVDTEGIGIESATAGGQFNEERIKKTLDGLDIFSRVKHKIVIIPGMAARLQEPLQVLANIKVWVGPRDSSGIAKFIQKKWDINKIKQKYK